MSLQARAQTNLKRLGLFAVVAAAYLAWRTFEDRPPTGVPPPPPTEAEPSPEPSPAPRAATPPPNADVGAVLDSDLDGESRRKAIYRLTQQGAAALPALRQILLTPVPEDPILNAFEVSLRITALEAIDDLAEQGVDVGDVFQKAAEVHDDRALQTLAMAGLQGVQEGRPGKAKRFIEKMTDEHD